MSAGKAEDYSKYARWPGSKNAWDTAMILEHDLMPS